MVKSRIINKPSSIDNKLNDDKPPSDEEKVEKDDGTPKLPVPTIPKDQLKEEPKPTDTDTPKPSNLDDSIENNPTTPSLSSLTSVVPSETYHQIQAKIHEFTNFFKTYSATKELNVDAMLLHTQITAEQFKAYQSIKQIVEDRGPTLSTTPQASISLLSFTSPLKIKIYNDIPSFFRVKTIGKPLDTTRNLETTAPKYLNKSIDHFGLGINETTFVFESSVLTPSINFNPSESSLILKDVVENADLATASSKTQQDYVLKIYETIFLMYLACQFILMKVPVTTLLTQTVYPADLVTQLGMLKHKFINQDLPILAAAGYNHACTYILDRMRDMFTPDHRHLLIGEISSEIFHQVKRFKKMAVITDQYLSQLNQLYLADLRMRHASVEVLTEQHRVLTMDNISIQCDNPTEIRDSLIPMWERGDCDGSLLMYALSIDRQKNYLNHLIHLISSTGLLTFLTLAEVGQLPPRANLRDPRVAQHIDTIVTGSNQLDVFRALALDMTTTWTDVTIEKPNITKDPVDAIFSVFTIMLWYMYFPSLARDNAHTLMYELFISLEKLTPEVRDYVKKYGFATGNTAHTNIRRYLRYDYYTGKVTFPFLTRKPTQDFKILRRIHEIITDISEHSVVATEDSRDIATPRMSNVRHFLQPFNIQSAVSTGKSEAEERNGAATRMEMMIENVIRPLIRVYNETHRRDTSKSTFGRTSVMSAELSGFFSEFLDQSLPSIGIRNHAEIPILRSLAANSIYIPDSQHNDTSSVRLRPQVIFETDLGAWRTVRMQRLDESLPFNVPFFMFLTMRGAASIDTIVPPDPAEQYANLQMIQEEGILCGDLIHYMQMLKFNGIGPLNNESLHISGAITAARADRVFKALASHVDFKNYSNLFTLMIDNVASRVDSRAMNFRIVLQPYEQDVYDSLISQPEETLYTRNLSLGRKLLKEVVDRVAPLFVPETSPIALYTNGLILDHRREERLDPFKYLNMEFLLRDIQRIVMWSPSLIRTIESDQGRYITTTVLELPNVNGDIDRFSIGDPSIPKTMIVVTADTGPISVYYQEFLFQLFIDRKLIFYYPELMVTIQRLNVPIDEKNDVLLEQQFNDVLLGKPNRRITVIFGDTTSNISTITRTETKRKWLFPTQQISDRDVILRNMNNDTEDANLKLGSWLSWAFGDENGSCLPLQPNDELPFGSAHVNTATGITIQKSELGLVNMNNTVEILERAECLAEPKFVMDIQRIYTGIYTDREN